MSLKSSRIYTFMRFQTLWEIRIIRKPIFFLESFDPFFSPISFITFSNVDNFSVKRIIALKSLKVGAALPSGNVKIIASKKSTRKKKARRDQLSNLL